jgi:hypothetical protein
VTPAPRNREAAKNFAGLAARFVFRSHSVADTTTAAVRPFRVMGWGSPDSARAITSLNFAFASATLQVLVVLASA